jgi:DNA mismatch endonuclease (patch repair protein)
MSKISGKDTKPEILVRRILFANGFRYRKNDKRYPGKPDIVLPKYKTVVFVNGCFWHGHKNCPKSKLPETNYEFWKTKIEKNIKRDQENYKTLEKQGWKVVVVWQCEINNRAKREIKLNEIIKILKQRTANKG